MASRVDHMEAAADSHAAARALLADPPRLHDWGRGWEVGGLTPRIGKRLIGEIGRYDSPRVIETGAGASTLLFCTLEPQAVTSIAPDAALRDRMLAAASERGISTERLDFICDRSELALPRLAGAGDRFDVALIDGSHNWPAVFVDFCYLNLMLPVGGTMFVDDVQLYSVAQLYNLLRKQEEYDYVGLDDKMATFRKVVDHPWLPEWRAQPYIEENTVVDPPPS
jgi:methyltransferase family protein